MKPREPARRKRLPRRDLLLIPLVVMTTVAVLSAGAEFTSRVVAPRARG